MTVSALSVRNAVVRYGQVEAVRGVSVDVPVGQIVTIIGANGAGKTSLLNGAMGLLRLEGGLHFHGQDIGELTIEDRVRAGLVLIPERRELFGSMTIEQNLMLGGFAQPARRMQTLESVFGWFPRLKERRNQIASTLSGGERQMLAMGRAMMSHPKVLMLDEPSLGLAPLIVLEIFAIIKRMRADGLSIVLVEQNARAALAIADYAYVMEHGELTLEGDGATVRSDPRVEEIYLGGSVD